MSLSPFARRMAAPCVAIALALVAPASRTLLAQGAEIRDASALSVTTRPVLPAQADTNDWNAYFDHGVRLVRDQPRAAAAAFYWASRLNPERAEPLFARWVAFHLSDIRRFEALLLGDAATMRHPSVVAADSLRLRALLRNPYVPQTLELYLFDRLSGRWKHDDLTLGWISYGAGHFEKALERLGRGIARDPERRAFARHTRAQAFVALARYDSALAEMQALRSHLARGDSSTVITAYQSREFIEYAIGFLEAARGRPELARDAMGRALTENLAFAPAHLFLADRLMEKGDVAGAIAEYDAAWALDSSDAVLAYRSAVALARATRLPEAEARLERAATLEPFYATPWALLGRVRHAMGNRDGARAAYERYLTLAPRSDTARRRDVEARLAALEASAPPG